MVYTQEQIKTLKKQSDEKGVPSEAFFRALYKRGSTIQGVDNDKIKRAVGLIEDVPAEQVKETKPVDLTKKSPSFQDKIKKESTPVTTVSEDIQEKDENQPGNLEQFSRGIGKSILSTVKGAGELGTKIGEQTAGRLVEAVTGEGLQTADIFTEGTEANKKAGEILEAEGAFEKAGEFAGEVAQFAIPGSQTSKATKGFNVFRKAIPQGVSSGSVATLQEGEVGKDTLLAAGIDAGFPVLGKVISKSLKGAKRVGEEVLGTLSGTSQETLEKGLEEAMASKESRKSFVKALRSESTPEEIVTTLKNNIEEVSSKRSQEYATQLSNIADEVVSTENVADDFIKEIQDSFGVSLDNSGGLNFAGSRLRTSPQAQNKLQETFLELKTLQNKGNTNIKDIDTTRQAISDIALKGDDASARTGNALITKASDKVRNIGKQVDGYEKLLNDFSESKSFTDDLERGLSSGDKKTVDQTYRRMVTAFKTNNEARMKLVNELDNITDGFVTAKITGQQLSEIMPRGIVGRIIAPLIGTSAVATGGASASFIPLLALSSPRVIGETISALGLSAQKSKVLKNAFSEAQDVISETIGVRKQDIINSLVTGEEIE